MGMQYQYFAFISYNHKDVGWGKRLQRKLENYRLPTTLCSQRGLERKPMRPVFFAPTDIQPNDLNDELKARLKASRNLVVICSPNSAKSGWVAQEIEYFYSLGRSKDIYLFIVDGVPNSGDPDTECYNPKIAELGLAGVLGPNVNEKNFRWGYLNRERAYVQLITKMLGIEFDTLWQRHKRQLVERILTYTLLMVLAVVSVVAAWSMNRPIDVGVALNELTEHNAKLPQLQRGEVTLYLDNDTITKRLVSADEAVIFPNIPRSMVGREVRVTFSGEGYCPGDVVVPLSRSMVLDIERDTLQYGVVRFRLRDAAMRKVSGCRVAIHGVEAVTDGEGYAELYIPLKSQDLQYSISCERKLSSSTIYVPCTGSEVIFVE